MIDMILYLKVSKNDIFRFNLFHFTPPSPKNFNLVLSFVVFHKENFPFLIIFLQFLSCFQNRNVQRKRIRVLFCFRWCCYKVFEEFFLYKSKVEGILVILSRRFEARFQIPKINLGVLTWEHSVFPKNFRGHIFFIPLYRIFIYIHTSCF